MLVFALLAAGSVDVDELMTAMEIDTQPDFHQGTVPDGNRVIVRSGTGTTLEKNAFKEGQTGKRHRFGGYVTDVTSESAATVQLGASHHATVTFTHTVAGLKKGQYVSFDATINSFGSGIVINHRLKDAVLIRTAR